MKSEAICGIDEGKYTNKSHFGLRINFNMFNLLKCHVNVNILCTIASIKADNKYTIFQCENHVLFE